MRLEAGQRRNLDGQAASKGRHRLRRAFHLNDHPGRGVLDPAGQPELPGQSVDERTKTHALDLTGRNMAATQAIWHAAQGSGLCRRVNIQGVRGRVRGAASP